MSAHAITTRAASHTEEVDLAARLAGIEATLDQIQRSLHHANDSGLQTAEPTGPRR